jgi:3-oxoacyl-(acyl-carrier-protein) synthase
MITLASASWPLSTSDSVPALAGFVESSFSPLAAEVARRCLSAHEPPPNTAVIIVSSSGDATSARVTAEAVESGRRPSPLLFFQAVPNAVAGYIAAKWNLTGPVICLSAPVAGDLSDGLALAELLFRDGDAGAALVINVEQGPSDVARALLVKGESA